MQWGKELEMFMDVEKGNDSEEDEESEDDNLEDEEERRRNEEEEKKKEKKRQEILELIHVFIAFIIIIGMAVGIVVIDNVLFPEDKNITFVPLDQKVGSTIRYTSNGYIPCLGMVPTPDDCSFPPYRVRMQRIFKMDRGRN